MGNNIGNFAGAFRPPPPPQMGSAGGIGGGQQGGFGVGGQQGLPPPPMGMGQGIGQGQGGFGIGGQQGGLGMGGQFGQGGGQLGQAGSQFGQGGIGFSGQSSFQPSTQQQQGPRLPPPELLADLGQALRIKPEQLAQKLQSGQSLSQVASSVGLNGSQLQSKIEGFLSQRLPNLTDSQRADMAQHIIAGAPPRPPPLPGMNGAQLQSQGS